MTKAEKQMWEIDLENTAAVVAEKNGNEVVKSVFRRYDAHGMYDLSPRCYSEVLGDLEFIASEKSV